MSKKNSSPVKNESKTWMFILENNLFKDKGTSITPDIVKLKHPRTGAKAMFLFSSDNAVIQELFVFSEKRSWFVNDTVRENGNMYLSTPVDPLFLILPFLKKSKEAGKVIPMEDLLIDEAYPETHRLFQCGLKHIQQIADKKGPEDINAWMYNEEKVLKWLSKKVEKVVEVLKEKKIKGNATSKNFIKGSKEETVDLDNELYVKYAHGLVSEYLSDDLSLLLSKRLGLPEESPEKKSSNKRKQTQLLQENNKKVKSEEEVPFEEILKPEKPKSVSAKEKAMKKAASGSKAITSFFKKK